MANYSYIEEKEFLEGYSKFSIEVRPFIIKMFCEAYRSHTDKDEKEILRILTIEQFFLLIETFEGFFRAIKDRESTPLLQSLNKNMNIQNLSSQLKGKDKNGILEELNIKVNNFESDIQNKIRERFVKMAQLFQRDDFCETIKKLIPVYNKLKHKMLAYKNKQGEIVIALEKETENKIINLLNTKGLQKENGLDDNIDYFFDAAQRLKSAIQDLIWVRLMELSL